MNFKEKWSLMKLVNMIVINCYCRFNLFKVIEGFIFNVSEFSIVFVGLIRRCLGDFFLSLFGS